MIGRLALERGGSAVDNPIHWYDSLAPGVQAFWSAYWRVEPWGMHWHQTAQVTTALNRIYHIIAKWFGHSAAVPTFDQSMPSDWIGEPSERNATPIEEQLSMASNGIGAKHGD